jgi:hypothetical protein
LVGCAKPQAASVPNGPPLEVPAPPPRLIAPVELAVAEEPLPEPAPEAPVAVEPERPAPAPARPAPQPPAAATPPPPATPPPDNRVLAAPTANTATERSVRDLLTRATQTLSRINYQRLSVDGKASYDQARRFAQQAEEALRERNVAFAHTLADKAAMLAAELP